MIIDNFLNKTPMYKVVIYALLSIVVVALVESYFGILDFSFISLVESLALIVVVTLVTNYCFAKSLKLPLQQESTIITALILFLILLPVENFQTTLALVVASFLAIASKYILVLRNTHLFNPAAFGIYSATLLGMILGFASSFWWVASIYLLPIVVIAGAVVVHKTRKFPMVLTGFLASLLAVGVTSYAYSMNILDVLGYTFISGPIIFFLAIMVTEPHTIAKTRSQQIFYASFIILFPLVFSFLNLYNIPPELSLLIGNLLSFVISHRARYILKLKDIKNLNQDQKEYLFKNTQDTKIPNKAGEYMEWLLPHKSVDSRGQRRYFTISSAPGANEISFATKFPPEKESSFKHALKDVQPGDTMYATQLGGDFLLPGKLNKNIIMLAGGIGITPFIAQLRDLLNKPENKIENLSLALFYCVKSKNDITFEDVLKEAVQKLKLKVVCVVTDTSDNNTIPEFFYESGYMSKEILKKYTQNLHNIYYISGPNIMVESIKKILHGENVKNKDIHTDYFPGF